MAAAAAGSQALSLTEDTVYKMLIAQVHVGAENMDDLMKRYIWSRRADGQYIMNLKYTWEKIVIAARIIAAVENPKDVAIISARDWGQRAVLKFAHYTQTTAIAGRFTPGTFTNQQQQKDFKEPRLILVTDTRVDHQPLLEASYVNIPTIAFANSDSPIHYVDVVIPCNNAAPQSIGLIYWLLCREVLRLKGTLNRDTEWDIMPDLFFWRDPTKEEEGKEEQEETFRPSASSGEHDRDRSFKPSFNTSGGEPAASTGGSSSGGAWVPQDNGNRPAFTPVWTDRHHTRVAGDATSTTTGEETSGPWSALT